MEQILSGSIGGFLSYEHCPKALGVIYGRKAQPSGFVHRTLLQGRQNLFSACPNCKKARCIFSSGLFQNYLTYSMTTLRLGSTPVEWVVMLSISCRAAWIT